MEDIIMIGYIYWIHNVLDDKRYIGSMMSSQKKKRENKHWRLLENGRKGKILKNGKKDIHHSLHLQNAYNKYGKNNFEFKVIEELTYNSEEELVIKEQEYIDLYHTLDSKYGYNCVPAHRNLMRETNPDNWEVTKRKMSAKIVSEETRLKISEAGKCRVCSEETRLKISRANKGRKLSDEVRERIRQSAKDRKRNKHTKKTKRKMSLAKLGKKRKPFSAEHRLSMSNARKRRAPFTDAQKLVFREAQRKRRAAEYIKRYHKKHATEGTKQSAEHIAKRVISRKKKGYSHSEETRLKIAASHKGIVVSEETKQKISKACKGRIVSPETRLKMSISGKGNPHGSNRHHSQKTKNKISRSNRGKHNSKDTAAKISAALKGRTSPNKGKKLSEETRRKISEANKGKIVSEETRAKIGITSLGRIHTEETKLKMSMIAKNRPKITEERRQKLCEGQRRRRALEMASKNILNL
jgi:hypothetical protein